MGVNTDDRREVLGLKVGHSEAEPFWTEFLRSLNGRGLRGVKLVISDSREALRTLPRRSGARSRQLSARCSFRSRPMRPGRSGDRWPINCAASSPGSGC